MLIDAPMAEYKLTDATVTKVIAEVRIDVIEQTSERFCIAKYKSRVQFEQLTDSSQHAVGLEVFLYSENVLMETPERHCLHCTMFWRRNYRQKRT